MSAPHVSVCIPSYNYGRFLGEAIESVLAQDYEDFELVVLDDGSTDESYAVACGFAARDPRVRVLTHPGRENRGVAASMEAAFAAAAGDLVCVLSADDMLYPGSLARRAEALDADPSLSFAYGLIEMVEADGSRTGRLVGTDPRVLPALDATDDPLEALLLHNYVPGHAIMVRRAAFDRAGGYDPRLPYNDWELSLKLMGAGAFRFLPAPPLAGHRHHDESMSLTAPTAVEAQRRRAVFLALDEKADGLEGRLREPRLRTLIRLQAIWFGFVADERATLADELDRAIEADPRTAADAERLLWWLGPRQSTAARDWILAALEDLPADAAAVTAGGAERGHFGCWFVELLTRSGRAPVATLERLRWGVLANELELAPRRLRPRVAAALAIRLVRSPTLGREPWFAKAVLCATGAWPAALAVRRRLGARGR